MENLYLNETFATDEDLLGIPATTVGNNLNKFIPQQMASPRSLGAEEIETPQGGGILDLLKSGVTGARNLFLQGAGATGGLNIGARLGMLVNPALAIPGALAGAFLWIKIYRNGSIRIFLCWFNGRAKRSC